MIRNILAVGLVAILSCGVFAGTEIATDAELIDTLVADDNRRKERRGGRQDNRDDKQDCRQEEGRVGNDKRECKQENRGEGDDAEADGAESNA